jgi:putative transposase
MALLALGGLDVSKAKRLRGLESENARLKKLLARQRGAKGPAGKKMVTPAVKREAVAHLRSAFDMSERRARRTINCVWMTMRYRSRRPDDSELRQRLRARH